MSVDEQLRSRVRAWGDAIPVDDHEIVPVIRRRGRRRHMLTMATSAMTAVVVIAGSVWAVRAIQDTGPVPPAATTARPPVARLEPADREFQRSYHVRYRWLVASGKTSGAQWNAWAFEQTPDQPCMAVDLGHGSCFAGFSTDNGVDFASGGQEPPAGGVFDVSGYTTQDVYQVRIDIVGRESVFVQTVGVGEWEVRAFAIVLPGRLSDVTVRGVVGLGSDGQEVRRPITVANDSAAVRGVVVTDDGTPIADAVVSYDSSKDTATTDGEGRFVIWRIPLRYECTLVTFRVQARGYASWSVIDSPLYRGQVHDLDVTLSKTTPTRNVVGAPLAGGESCRRADGSR